MVPFSLGEYIKNPKRKVVTREGQDVRILCTDVMGTSYPVLAVCKVDSTHEYCYSYTDTGKQFKSKDSPTDLFFAPEKKEGWITVYKDGDDYHTGGTEIYSSEFEAVNHLFEDVSHLSKKFDFIKTVKIEWEE